MARRHDKTGRSTNGPPFVQLFHYMLDSPAWLSLSLPARAAFVELARRYNGANNGLIGMSATELGERIGKSKATAARALNELEEKGFVAVTKVGTFRRKDRQASEYRLTLHRCDVSLHPPSKDFMRRRPANGSNTSPPRSHQRDGTAEITLDGLAPETVTLQ